MNLLLALLLVLPGSVAAPAARWSWPVDPPRVVTRTYIAPATPWAAGHRGIDIEAWSAVVRAPADGVIHFAGFVVDRPVLSIAHAGGVLSSFEPVTTTLVAGDRVRRGDVIGTLEPGHCPVVLCLHLGARIGGEYVSPLLFLGGVPRSVLMPTRDARGDASRRPLRTSIGISRRWTLRWAKDPALRGDFLFWREGGRTRASSRHETVQVFG